MDRLDQLLKKEPVEKRTVAVAQAAEEGILETIAQAESRNLCSFLLFGEAEQIHEAAGRAGVSLGESISIIDTPAEQSSMAAVRAVSEGSADVVMKGNVDTATLMKQVLHKEYGLTTGKVLSHVALFDFPDYDRILFLTDSAMNISPQLKEKSQIIENAVQVAHQTGIPEPKVAVLAAVEKVNPSMEATTDAALLAQMNYRNQIKGCIVDGPLAFDNAVNEQAARQKGIESNVAGKADVLVAPDIEVANVLYKSFVYFGNARVAGMISGAKAPIVVTSRSDSPETKLLSLALAVQKEEE
ncbi:bifunctional enoyl-CoA hydratase/phosphate acetyltransferase [Salimicrobium halophilum]|uniref:Phosphate butyryltransferase n=1 Tax=Salimicrobium halophilum TaxID=86666 RepID=A0A1G8PVK2_9BACI|nr:bifunctional enoyl-CoA hydratase/phosphate acetyltransferase [Salimicrobium halophilum]SDI96544.1 phosphate butyryltransferase [Salimicrobium halophilum]